MKTIKNIILDVNGVLGLAPSGINDEMVVILRQLQPHYRLFALTNTGGLGEHPLKKQLEPFLEAFVQSGEIGLAKPDPAVFKYMLQTYGLKAEETLFIDDSAANVAGARAIGIHAVLFTGLEAFVQELKKYQVQL